MLTQQWSRFGDRILEIIRELIEANESEPDAAIVVLADQDKETMDNIIRDNILKKFFFTEWVIFMKCFSMMQK